MCLSRWWKMGQVLRLFPCVLEPRMELEAPGLGLLQSCYCNLLGRQQAGEILNFPTRPHLLSLPLPAPQINNEKQTAFLKVMLLVSHETMMFY